MREADPPTFYDKYDETCTTPLKAIYKNLQDYFWYLQI